METAVEVRGTEVWVVDDSADDRLLIELAAAELDCPPSLTFVECGSDLVDVMRAPLPDRLPDLVVLDLRMPGIDGHTTLEILQQHPGWSDVPVVVFSTTTRVEDRERAIELGARSMVSKPSHFAEMVGFVSSLVEAP